MRYSLQLSGDSFEALDGNIPENSSPARLRVLSVLDRPTEEINHVSLDIQEETLRFLCGSKAIS